MAERRCAVCGHNKNVRGGVICSENDHFICESDYKRKRETFATSPLKKCPLDGSQLT